MTAKQRMRTGDATENAPLVAITLSSLILHKQICFRASELLSQWLPWCLFARQWLSAHLEALNWWQGACPHLPWEWANHQALVLPPEAAAAAPSAADLKAQDCILMCIFLHRATSQLRIETPASLCRAVCLGNCFHQAWFKAPLGKEDAVIPVGHHRSSLTGATAAACRAPVMQGGFLQKKGLSCGTQLYCWVSFWVGEESDADIFAWTETRHLFHLCSCLAQAETRTPDCDCLRTPTREFALTELN